MSFIKGSLITNIIIANENIDKIANITSIQKTIASMNSERLKFFMHSSSDTENAILFPTLCAQYVA